MRAVEAVTVEPQLCCVIHTSRGREDDLVEATWAVRIRGIVRLAEVDAARARRNLRIPQPSGDAFELELPPGAEDGDELVVKERGMPSSKDGERGDLRVRVVVS